MRILLLTPLPPNRSAPGAIPAVVHAAVVGLRERNDVTIVTAASGPEELDSVAQLRADGYTIQSVPRHMDRSRWVRRTRMARAWLGGVPWRTVWFHEPALQPVLDKLLAEQAFDVVAVEDNSMGTYQLKTRAPTILTEHEVRAPRGLNRPPSTPRAWPGWGFRELDWRRWPRYQQRVWARFDALQVFTNADKAMLAELAPEIAADVYVTPFGIDLPPSDSSSPTTEGLAFIGDYSHPPNIDAAIWLATEVLPRVRDVVPGARLQIAGRNTPRAVSALASGFVDVLGMVPDADEFISSHAVLVAPVRTGGGMRMKVLHAMALGSAVVTTPLGARGLESDGVLPVAVGSDTDSLAAEVVRLLRDSDARRQLGERARAFVWANHTPDAFARRLEAVYANVIESKRHNERNA